MRTRKLKIPYTEQLDMLNAASASVWQECLNLQEVWCYAHVLLLSCLISLGCNRSAAPPERQQAEIDKIIKQVAALNAKADTHRANALEYDEQIKAYRQEMQHLRSQMGAARKDPKAQIRRLKFFANQAKKARKKENLSVKIYTRKIEEIVYETTQ